MHVPEKGIKTGVYLWVNYNFYVNDLFMCFWGGGGWARWLHNKHVKCKEMWGLFPSSCKTYYLPLLAAFQGLIKTMASKEHLVGEEQSQHTRHHHSKAGKPSEVTRQALLKANILTYILINAIN